MLKLGKTYYSNNPFSADAVWFEGEPPPPVTTMTMFVTAIDREKKIITISGLSPEIQPET